MAELTLGNGDVHVAPPVVPTLRVSPPGLPGPPGPPGPPGTVGSADHVQLTRTAAAALSGQRAVTPLPDGTLVYASHADPAHRTAPVWLTAAAAAAGAEVVVLAYGHLSEPSWSWTPGPLYLGAGGLLTQTPPAAPAAAFLRQLGYATGPTTVFIDQHPPITLI